MSMHGAIEADALVAHDDEEDDDDDDDGDDNVVAGDDDIDTGMQLVPSC